MKGASFVNELVARFIDSEHVVQAGSSNLSLIGPPGGERIFVGEYPLANPLLPGGGGRWEKDEREREMRRVADSLLSPFLFTRRFLSRQHNGRDTSCSRDAQGNTLPSRNGSRSDVEMLTYFLPFLLLRRTSTPFQLDHTLYPHTTLWFPRSFHSLGDSSSRGLPARRPRLALDGPRRREKERSYGPSSSQSASFTSFSDFGRYLMYRFSNFQATDHLLPSFKQRRDSNDEEVRRRPRPSSFLPQDGLFRSGRWELDSVRGPADIDASPCRRVEREAGGERREGVRRRRSSPCRFCRFFAPISP